MCRQAAVHSALRRILSCLNPFVLFLVIPDNASLFALRNDARIRVAVIKMCCCEEEGSAREGQPIASNYLGRLGIEIAMPG